LESEGIFNEVHYLARTPLQGHYDVFVHEESFSFVAIYVIPNSLERSHLSLMHSQPSCSPKCFVDVPNDISKLCDSNIDMGYADNMFHMLGGNVETFESLGNFSGYNAALDLYCINLVDKPRKILWNTFFAFSFDFSMAFSLIKRALIFFALILCMIFYCQACEPHAKESDKLLSALTASEWRARVLTKRWSG